MKLTVLILKLSLAATITNAAIMLETRQTTTPYTINLFQETNYTGRKVVYKAYSGICYSIVEENNDLASSVQVSSGGKCAIYADRKCAGTSITVTAAASNPNLGPSGLNDQVTAFRCSAA